MCVREIGLASEIMMLGLNFRSVLPRCDVIFVFLSFFPHLNIYINTDRSTNHCRRGRDRTVIGLTTSYAINAYHR